MKPPTRERKTRVLQAPPKSESQKQKRFKRSFAEGGWKPKERRLILSELNKITNPKLPDVLPRLQRAVPTPSIAEIEQMLNEILKPCREKQEAKEKEFVDTNIKKWLDCCDRHSGMQGPTTSLTGNAQIMEPHPGMSLSSIFREYAANSECIHSYGSGQFNHLLNYSKVYSFFADMIEGKEPFTQWGDNILDAAVVLEIAADIQHLCTKAKFPEQAKIMWDKYQRVKDGTVPPCNEPEQVSTLYESVMLNPMGFTEEQTQSVVTADLEQELETTWYKY